MVSINKEASCTAATEESFNDNELAQRKAEEAGMVFNVSQTVTDKDIKII